MKKAFLLFILFTSALFSQSKFAVEAGGGIDLVMESGSYNSYDNGYSIIISPIYKMNEIISFMAGFAFHRVEGYQSYQIITPQIFPNYSIDNPAKPNIKTYDFSLGMRTNFSEKTITPYFVLKTGFLFIDVPKYSNYYYYPLPSENEHKIDYYFSPGFGVNFRMINNLNILIEGRFMIKTGNDYSYLPLTTSVAYYF